MSHTQTASVNVATAASVPVVSVKPIVLAAPDRGNDLQVRVGEDMSDPRVVAGVLLALAGTRERVTRRKGHHRSKIACTRAAACLIS